MMGVRDQLLPAEPLNRYKAEAAAQTTLICTMQTEALQHRLRSSAMR